MRKLILLSLVFAGPTLAGCQSEPAPTGVPATTYLHGGILIPLTDNQAYVELLNDKRERKAGEQQMDLVAYVLGPDQKTPLGETPTSVDVKILTTKGEKTVQLKAAPDSSDPTASRRFLSAMGPYELSQTVGEVTVLVGGKTLSGKFRGPR